MAGMNAAGPPAPDYAAVFRSHIQRGLDGVLAGVRREGAPLPETLRAQALHLLGYALDLPEAWPVAGDLLVALAPPLEQAGYRDEWMPFLERGIERALAAGDLAVAAELRLQLGILHQLRGNYDRARGCLEASVASFQAVDDRRGQARALNRLAYVGVLQRRYESATTALQLARDVMHGDDPEHAYANFVEGAVAFDYRDWRVASDCYEKALQIWESTDNLRMVAWSLTNLGTALRRLGQNTAAIMHFRRAIDLFEVIEDPANMATVNANLGNAYLDQDDADRALGQYLEAEPILSRTHDILALAKIRNNKGVAYRKLKRWVDAENAYLSSIEHWESMGHVTSLVNAMDGLALTYLGMNRNSSAVSVLQAALARLTSCSNQPGYEHLRKTIERHLKLAQSNSETELL